VEDAEPKDAEVKDDITGSSIAKPGEHSCGALAAATDSA
jgi:hypothetical protein